MIDPNNSFRRTMCFDKESGEGRMAFAAFYVFVKSPAIRTWQDQAARRIGLFRVIRRFEPDDGSV